MEAPRRTGDDPSPDQQFERLRSSFASELEQWPDFVGPPDDGADDLAPLADLEETDDHYLLDVELPGVRRDAVDLQVEQHRLVVRGTRPERRRTGVVRHRSRSWGRFALAVLLPAPIDSDGVTATLDDGVLAVVAPKAGPVRRRRIAVDLR